LHQNRETEFRHIANCRVRTLRFGLIILLLLHQFSLRADTAATNSPAQTNSLAPATQGENLSSDEPVHSKQDFEARVVTNVPPGTIATTNGAVPTKTNFNWTLDWKGWDGLHWGLSQRTDLKSIHEMLGRESTNNEPVFHLEQLKMSGKIGGRLEVDGAAYETSKNLDLANEFGLRRARIIIQGDCILLFPLTYKIEIGYVPHKFDLSEAWLSSDHIDYIGYIVAGVFQPPMGLDDITSSRDLTLMEPASVLQSLGAPNEAGLQIGQPVFDKRGTWALGLFHGGINAADEYGNDSKAYGNLRGRFTYLAIDRVNPKIPDENEYLHLGISANIQYSSTSEVRYRSRPESYFATYLIDTGVINANSSGEAGVEAAYVNGPWCLEAEFIDSVVREDNDAKPNFYGAYGTLTWYLTGESRPYNRQKGCFARLIPRRNLDLGEDDDGGWGALALSARVSYTDLTDRNIDGGRMGLLMTGLNWYPHSHVRWMFDIGGGHVSGGPHDGNVLVIQSRIGIDF
jgi:phosphate-selective porin OprO/OprP